MLTHSTAAAMVTDLHWTGSLLLNCARIFASNGSNELKWRQRLLALSKLKTDPFMFPAC